MPKPRTPAAKSPSPAKGRSARGGGRKKAAAEAQTVAGPAAELPDLPYRQALFVLEYLVDLNATQAAIRAGYSPDSAAAIGHENLRKPEIATAIADAVNARAVRVGITADRVLRELAVIGFSDHAHYRMNDWGGIDITADAPPHASRAIASVKHKTRTDEDGNTTHETEFRLWSKTDALKQLADHLGLSAPKQIRANVTVTEKPGRLEDSTRADMLRRFLAEQAN